MTFVCFTTDQLALRYDQISSVRSLGEGDIDVRTGRLRSGIPEDAVTEIVTLRGTYYTSMPFAELVQVIAKLERGPGVGDD